MAILKENWTNLIKPSSIDVEYLNPEKTKAVISIESLERGYGITLGNSIRRVLLSSIMGFAITSIKIDGILNQFSTIEGVREDVLDIIMNIKNLVITKENNIPTTIKLKANKIGVVKAENITVFNDVQILNPELIICNIEGKDVNLDIEMTVEAGVGYALAEEKQRNNNELGKMYLDTLFSPIKKIAYTVENARIGQKTDYDKLILEISTNGVVSPEDAIGLAAKIIQEQLEVFINFQIPEESKINTVEDELNAYNPNLFKKIDEMELSVRSYNCLNNENIFFISDLVQKTETEMLKLPNFGKKSLNELKDNLKVMDLNFGIKLENWPPEGFNNSTKK